MSKPAKYPTTPVETDKMPSGIAFIIGNEAAERFCFYGMRTILVVFMTKYLLSRNGTLDVMSPEDAKGWFHVFVMAVYFLPLFGAILSDVFWGKFKTVLWLSIVYCLGSFTLAIDTTRLGLVLGLSLIAIGSGGIKPCVSANVGDQFGPRNNHLLSKVFGWFYFSINFGSFFSTMLTPVLLDRYGPRVAFGVPGVFMLLATVIFWMGRHKFVRVPPVYENWVEVVFSIKGLKTFVLGFLALGAIVFAAHFGAGLLAFILGKLGSVGFVERNWVICFKLPRILIGLVLFAILLSRFAAVRTTWPYIRGLVPIFLAEAVFWSLWDQTGSAWVLQAEKMNLKTLEFTWLPSQVQAVNPILILLLIPVCTYLLYPAIGKIFPLTPLRKIGIGLFLTVPSFLITAHVESQIQAGLKPTIAWHFLGFLIISLAEIMVSITCLEFAYTQAPKKLKSLIMSLNLLSISLGNAVTAGINFFIKNADGTSKLPGASYFNFFAGMMLVTAIAFIFVAMRYKERDVTATGQPPKPS